jgi:acetolactate synthase-1/3 small subunit
MAMRRGVHTSRVLKALATPNGSPADKIARRPKLSKAEIIPNQFPGLEEEEE